MEMSDRGFQFDPECKVLLWVSVDGSLMHRCTSWRSPLPFPRQLQRNHHFHCFFYNNHETNSDCDKEGHTRFEDALISRNGNAVDSIERTPSLDFQNTQSTAHPDLDDTPRDRCSSDNAADTAWLSATNLATRNFLFRPSS